MFWHFFKREKDFVIVLTFENIYSLVFAMNYLHVFVISFHSLKKVICFNIFFLRKEIVILTFENINHLVFAVNFNLFHSHWDIWLMLLILEWWQECAQKYIHSDIQKMPLESFNKMLLMVFLTSFKLTSRDVTSSCNMFFVCPV